MAPTWRQTRIITELLQLLFLIISLTSTHKVHALTIQPPKNTIKRGLDPHQSTTRLLSSSRKLNTLQPNESNNKNPTIIDRRSAITRATILSTATTLSILTSPPSSSHAATTSTSTTTTPPPVITHKIQFNVRISRSDGTFYVRDNDPPDDDVYTGRIIFALYGNNAPNHVAQFLKYVTVPFQIDDPLPSYSRSVFTSLNPADGLLVGGVIPGLETTLMGGGDALQYGGRILPAKLWIEGDRSLSKVRHDERGLLTHRALELSPMFGITTRANNNDDMDGTHVVFGRLLMDDGDGKEFLSRCEEIKTYAVEKADEFTVGGNGGGSAAVEGIATSVFNKQREFFRGAAKTFGDTRLEKVFEGKFLRRVDVTSVELL